MSEAETDTTRGSWCWENQRGKYAKPYKRHKSPSKVQRE